MQHTLHVTAVVVTADADLAPGAYRGPSLQAVAWFLRPWWALAFFLLALLVASPSDAAMGDPSPSDPPWLTAARADLKAQRFEQMAAA
ncbi:MAG: hypothetical protein ACK52R_02490, partial [Betaproteobacteria bacterium]